MYLKLNKRVTKLLFQNLGLNLLGELIVGNLYFSETRDCGWLVTGLYDYYASTKGGVRGSVCNWSVWVSPGLKIFQLSRAGCPILVLDHGSRKIEINFFHIVKKFCHKLQLSSNTFLMVILRRKKTQLFFRQHGKKNLYLLK